MLWPPNHHLQIVGLTPNAIDNCDTAVSLVIEVWSDETEVPQAGDGSGDHAPDAKDLDTDLRLRKERRGTEDGRVYLIIATATDASGNVGYDCCVVLVAHDRHPNSQANVIAQGAAAMQYCLENNGTPPPAFFQHGVSEELGPFQ